MAQKIVIVCDVHQRSQDTEVPGDEYVVSVQLPGSAKPTTYAIDLCADCAKPVADLAEMLSAAGRTLGGRTRAASATVAHRSTPAPGSAHAAGNGGLGLHTCPVDGCGAVLANRGSLTAHIRTQHGTTLAAVTGGPEPYTCEFCDFRSSKPQGLSAHVRAAHPA